MYLVDMQELQIMTETPVKFCLFCSKYDSELMMNRSTKQMKRGSDHAVTKTSISGTENDTDTLPKSAKAGKEVKCLKLVDPTSIQLDQKKVRSQYEPIRRDQPREHGLRWLESQDRVDRAQQGAHHQTRGSFH
jgi:hypothetical protein